MILPTLSRSRRRALAAGAALFLSAPGAYAQDPDNAPISIAVTSPMAGQGGLNRALQSLAEGNTEETARDLQGALVQYAWIRVVPQSPDVLVQVERRSRTESKTTDKEGKITVHHKYRIDALVDAGRGARVPVHSEHTLNTPVNGYRDDSGVFRNMAAPLAVQVIYAIGSQLDVLRPNRARAGFAYQPKYKMLVRGDGLEVTAVQPGGPAEQAGLRVGDRIKRINTEKGTDQMAFIGGWWWISGAGSRHEIEYERNKSRFTTTLVLAAPEGRAAAPTAAAPAPAPAPAAAAPAAAAPARAAQGGTSRSSNEVQLRVGMTEAELLRALGEPNKKVSFPPKSVWTYDAFTVTLTSGKVTDIK